MIKLLIFLFGILLLMQMDILLTGCGQILAPTGGPRDSLPPRLLSADPPNSGTSFKGNRIVLNFDEYVVLDQLRENLLVSPAPKNDPYIDYKLRSIIIRLRDTLEANTTYSINLGNAIRDLNEGNIYRNFTYTFSTGATIDSLEFSGKVEMAETGTVDSTLLVMLYSKTADSAVMTEKPKYITRIRQDGNFSFKNLSAATYKVYALKDADGSRTYNKKTEVFAFADTPVLISEDTPPVTLYAYAEEKDKGGTRATADSRLRYSTRVTIETQDIQSGLDIEFSRPIKTFKREELVLLDSAGRPVSGVTVKMDTSNKKLTVTNTWRPAYNYRLVIGKDIAIDTGGSTLLKSDTLRFSTKSESDYGSLKLKIANPDKKQNPVLQLVLNNIVVSSHPLTSNEWFAPKILAGTYELRILFDTNRNGIWDPGNFATKRQPERVLTVPKRENVRGGWDSEVEIVL